MLRHSFALFEYMYKIPFRYSLNFAFYWDSVMSIVITLYFLCECVMMFLVYFSGDVCDPWCFSCSSSELLPSSGWVGVTVVRCTAGWETSLYLHCVDEDGSRNKHRLRLLVNWNIGLPFLWSWPFLGVPRSEERICTTWIRLGVSRLTVVKTLQTERYVFIYHVNMPMR